MFDTLQFVVNVRQQQDEKYSASFDVGDDEA
jgi:hypothetical protein